MGKAKARRVEFDYKYNTELDAQRVFLRINIGCFHVRIPLSRYEIEHLRDQAEQVLDGDFIQVIDLTLLPNSQNTDKNQ